MISASPAYYGCPECGHGEMWLLTDGTIMCADWPDCGVVLANRWKPLGSEYGFRKPSVVNTPVGGKNSEEKT